MAGEGTQSRLNAAASGTLTTEIPMRRWLSTTAILFGGLMLTTVVIQFAAIGVLDISSGRLFASCGVAAAQAIAVAALLRYADGRQ